MDGRSAPPNVSVPTPPNPMPSRSDPSSRGPARPPSDTRTGSCGAPEDGLLASGDTAGGAGVRAATARASITSVPWKARIVVDQVLAQNLALPVSARGILPHSRFRETRVAGARIGAQKLAPRIRFFARSPEAAERHRATGHRFFAQRAVPGCEVGGETRGRRGRLPCVELHAGDHRDRQPSF